jgi:hypothetical protein
MEKALVWVSACELRRMRRDMRIECCSFLESHPTFVDCLDRAFTSPISSLPGAAQSSDLQSAVFDREAFVEQQLGGEDAPRGLEYRMSSLICRHKQFTTSAVLQRQRQLSRLPSPSSCGGSARPGNASVRWRNGASTPDALAALCAHLSQCTRELALAYGRADAVRARAAYGEMGVVSSGATQAGEKCERDGMPTEQPPLVP